MSSKTKIVVLHTKEVIYTGIFVVLAVVLAVLLFLMFGKIKMQILPVQMPYIMQVLYQPDYAK